MFREAPSSERSLCMIVWLGRFRDDSCRFPGMVRFYLESVLAWNRDRRRYATQAKCSDRARGSSQDHSSTLFLLVKSFIEPCSGEIGGGSVLRGASGFRSGFHCKGTKSPCRSSRVTNRCLTVGRLRKSRERSVSLKSVY